MTVGEPRVKCPPETVSFSPATKPLPVMTSVPLLPCLTGKGWLAVGEVITGWL